MLASRDDIRSAACCQLVRGAWEEGTLDDTTLQPGQETAFHLNLYTTYCFTDDMVVLGQGAIQR